RAIFHLLGDPQYLLPGGAADVGSAVEDVGDGGNRHPKGCRYVLQGRHGSHLARISGAPRPPACDAAHCCALATASRCLYSECGPGVASYPPSCNVLLSRNNESKTIRQHTAN